MVIVSRRQALEGQLLNEAQITVLYRKKSQLTEPTMNDYKDIELEIRTRAAARLMVYSNTFVVGDEAGKQAVLWNIWTIIARTIDTVKDRYEVINAVHQREGLRQFACTESIKFYCYLSASTFGMWMLFTSGHLNRNIWHIIMNGISFCYDQDDCYQECWNPLGYLYIETCIALDEGQLMRHVWGNSFFAAVMDRYIHRNLKGDLLDKHIKSGLFAEPLKKETLEACANSCLWSMLCAFLCKDLGISHDDDTIAYELLVGTGLFQCSVTDVLKVMENADYREQSRKDYFDTILMIKVK